MRMSRLFMKTLRETPADAEIASHQLMLRASLVHQVAAGIFDYLPLGHRVKRKVEAIMRHTPMARFGKSEELVGAALLLASPKAGSFITGTEMIVDGGYSAMTI